MCAGNLPADMAATQEPRESLPGTSGTSPAPASTQTLRLIIGDASGKGVAAALVMALTSSLVEIHARQAVGPAELLNRLNTELFPRFTANHMCVALLVAEFDPRTRQLCVANAGMVAPLRIADGGCSYVPAYGAPLGVVYGAMYSATTVALEPDQLVVLISDGIIEARSPDDNLWGFERFEATVCATVDGVEDVVANVLRAVRRHVAGRDLFDDMTIIAATLVPTQLSAEEPELVMLGEGQGVET